ncbi:SseB family protein [Auraticoccus cholistanensis]|nr:SseB family protein [Auraticoccus cholistanensis]
MPELSRTLADPLRSFADDTGEADPAVREALRRSETEAGEDSYLQAVAALCGSRLLTPVVAVGELAADGGDKSAEMSTVMLQDACGERAMLVFTGVDALQRWNPTARPVPATLDKVAEATLAGGAVALLVDLNGPYPLVLEDPVLSELARGRRLVTLADGGFGWLQAAPRERG